MWKFSTTKILGFSRLNQMNSLSFLTKSMRIPLLRSISRVIYKKLVWTDLKNCNLVRLKHHQPTKTLIVKKKHSWRKWFKKLNADSGLESKFGCLKPSQWLVCIVIMIFSTKYYKICTKELRMKVLVYLNSTCST